LARPSRVKEARRFFTCEAAALLEGTAFTGQATAVQAASVLDPFSEVKEFTLAVVILPHPLFPVSWNMVYSMPTEIHTCSDDLETTNHIIIYAPWCNKILVHCCIKTITVPKRLNDFGSIQNFLLILIMIIDEWIPFRKSFYEGSKSSRVVISTRARET
jgi:hypothetical protein